MRLNGKISKVVTSSTGKTWLSIQRADSEGFIIRDLVQTSKSASEFKEGQDISYPAAAIWQPKGE